MEVKLLSYLPNGTIINNGKYEILSPVGSGGFGHTYKAIQIDDNKLIAIKELFVDSICNRVEGSLEVVVAVASRIEQFNKLKKKFINEAKALCSYHHPHIVHAYEVFEENGTAYYSMDFIDGSPLSLVVSSHGAISESIALHYIRHIAEALAYIHDRNRLHLDVKPSNIMIDKYGNAYLIDFGTSKQYSLETNDNTTTLLAISKNYSPAEQATYGVTYFSPEMDIYALGATMYKTLSGITPPESVLLSSGIKKLQPLPDDISKPVRIAIDCAMQQEASRRPQSIQELWEIIDDMHPIQGETTVLDIFTEMTKDEETSAIETMAEVTKNVKDKHESVDLGISVEWATYNVGAKRPEEFGKFYAWGETDTKSNYIAENYMFQRLASKDFKRKRIIDQDNDLTPYYDVVTEEWGPEWRMPTMSEYKELIDKCHWEWTKEYGVSGYHITGPNGNSIFMPAAGFVVYQHQRIELQGFYWSASSDWGASSDKENEKRHYLYFYYLYFSSDKKYVSSRLGFNGQVVRGVKNR